jgi:threonylcarbamoyladenosine tRNA methylthiotransferase MtaB
MKYSVVTFGCRVNQADSLGFEADLLARGAIAAPPDVADLVIVNTCSVTASADQGARQTIRRVSKANPAARIVVTGCYATRAPHEVAGLPVLRVVRNDDKARLVDLLGGDHALGTARRFGDGEGSCGAAVEPGVAGRTAFTLRVQTGCRERCAYCIIPSTRGEPRSLPVADVIAGLARAVDQGFKEVAVTGVHLGSYGRDLSPALSLVDLLAAIERSAPADLRIRISSLEPMDCPEPLVDLVAGSRVFAPHFHLPLQHASDRVLRLMRRSYSLSQYAGLVEGIRRRLPDASIGTDLIVGFPGETDTDVDVLAEYLERSPLTHAHVFPYSDRPGTVASAMPGKVSGLATRERGGRIRAIASARTAEFHGRQVGRVHRGLTLEDGTLVVTGNYLKVRIPPGHARNEWLDVRVTAAGGSMAGVVVGASLPS